MDLYYEETVPMRNCKTRKILRALGIFLTLILIVCGFRLLISLSMWSTNAGEAAFYVISGLVLLGLGIFVWFRRNDLVYDYDYIVVNGDLKIVKVVSQKTRKLALDIKAVQIGKIGRYGSKDYESLLANPKVKKTFLTPNKKQIDGKNAFYIAYHRDAETEVAVLECTKEYIRTVLKFINRTTLDKELDYNDLLG